MVDKKDSIKTNWLDSHDLNEIIKTADLKILPKYDIIRENDLLTTRKVVIVALPVSKTIEKDGKTLELSFITIMDNEIEYSLPFNSKALQRSLLMLAINECQAHSSDDIDLSVLIGKMVGIKREQFTAKGFTQSPYKFYTLGKK